MIEKYYPQTSECLIYSKKKMTTIRIIINAGGKYDKPLSERI